MKPIQWMRSFFQSPWASIGWKALGGGAILIFLAIVGMGRVRALLPKTAEASPIESARVRAAPSPSSSPPPVSPILTATASASVIAPPKPLVILNTATEAELDALPGIGKTTAARIVALREKMVRFKRPEDLLRVKGIKRRLLAKIRPFIALDPPAPSSSSSAPAIGPPPPAH
jgi:competence protein ComEA